MFASDRRVVSRTHVSYRLDVGDFFCFRRPQMNCVLIKNRCASVDGSELAMSRAIVRMSQDRELVKSAVMLEPMNRPTMTGVFKEDCQFRQQCQFQGEQRC
jgi:hypothetical protein